MDSPAFGVTPATPRLLSAQKMGTASQLSAENRCRKPSTSMSASSTTESNGMTRRAFMISAFSATAAAASLTVPLPATAREKTRLTGEYKDDAETVLADMRIACDLARGSPGMSDTVGKTRREMIDFVALYRRNQKVAGKTSFSTLYTAINTLSGHYASYGNAYPVPEKRKKRLTQQFTEIDRALNRGR